MMQRLFDSLAGLSLLLTIAAIVLWVRSYGVSERLDWRGPSGWRMIRTAQGKVVVKILRADWSNHPNEFHGPKYSTGVAQGPINHLMFLCSNSSDVHSDYKGGSFEWHELRDNRQGTLHAMGAAPFWYVTIMTAMTPLWWMILHCRRRQ